MTMPIALGSAISQASAAPAAEGGERARLAEAAKQFEAIFLRQMLSSARSANFGGEDVFGGKGEETFQEMRDARFAEIASNTGAIGLAASIEKQLARFIGPEG